MDFACDDNEVHELTVKLKNQVSSDRQRYYGDLLPSYIKSAPEKFWRSISPKSEECDVFDVNGALVHETKEIANLFNVHFKSVFTRDNSILPSYDVALPPIPDIEITESGVFNMLLNLDIRKSSGPDDIPNCFLKRYAEWVSKYLKVLFMKSLEFGQVPGDWKTARVKPLHKTGNKQHIKNYRPISLTSTACKILEHIIHKHILEFLEKHKFLTIHQHGFRKGYSTITQLVQTVHDFANNINNGKQTDAIFMDFSKAFDKVSHQKLLHKLNIILNNPQLINWISDYLSGRSQFVTFKNHDSDRLSVDSGVPQGSVLGPLFFLLYINDMANDLPVKIKLYADDCVLYSTIDSHSDQMLLNDAFQQVVAWCKDWQMSVNFEKTVFMCITNKKDKLSFHYSANNIFLSEVTEYKYLGLHITNTLKWDRHIEKVTANAYRRLFFLRRALKLSIPSVRLLAYKTVILPVLDYAAIIWDPYTQANIKKLERVQRKAVRFIYNNYSRTSVTELLKQANLPALTERNRVSRLKFLFQLINKHYNIDISDIITFSSGYATRQRHHLTLTPFRVKNNCFKYSFFPRSVTEWNNLTNTQVAQPSLSSFAANIS